MKKRLLAVALGLIVSGRAALALDANSQKLADRYLSLLEGNPTQKTALDRLCKIFEDAGEKETLAELGRKSKNPLLAALILERTGHAAEAEAILKSAAESGDGPAAGRLASRLEEQGKAGEAAELLEKAAAAAPAPDLYMQLGAIRQKAGDFTGARDAWEQAIALDPHNLVLRKQLARAAASAGDSDLAVEHYKAIAEQGSPAERFEAWQEISRNYEAAGMLAEAIAAQESLLSLMGPGHWQIADSRRRLLDLHRRAGTLDSLEDGLVSAASSRPRDAQAALRLAEYYEFAGKSAKRLEWLSKAAELLPGDASVNEEAARLELASGSPEKAAARYDRLLALRPADADLIFARAEIEALKGDEAAAEKRMAAFLANHAGDDSAAQRVEEFYRRMHLSAARERGLVTRFEADRTSEAAAVELARFYLSESRYKDAEGTLAKFDGSRLKAGETAAAAYRFSRMLEEAHSSEAALFWARRASSLAPASPDYALHAAELLAGQDGAAEAQDILRRACEQRDGLPREDLDRRLHLLTQAAAKKAAPGTSESGGMDRAISNLRERLREPEATTADWLRLARWLRWSSMQPQWVATLRDGTRQKPESKELREALATALVDTGDTGGAIRELSGLIERYPDSALEYRRRIGRLEQDRGNAEEGLRIFSNLASERPRDWQAGADLALAEQVAGNWFKALDTWEGVYRKAPPESKTGIRQPLLNAAARLQLHDRALAFLDGAVEMEKDAAAREDLLREAASYAAQNHVSQQWHEYLDRHIADSPEERHWGMGKVFLLEAEGRRAKARQMLVDLQRNVVESAAVLEPQVKAAEDAGDWIEAARLTRRLISLSRQPDSSLGQQLAKFLEKAGKWDQAREAWTAVATLHGRDSASLTAAAEFFDRIGDEERMEACYRAAAKLGGCAPQVLLRLGRLALDRGDRFQALADFETVIERVRPDAGDAKIVLPLPDVLMEASAPASAPSAATLWRRSAGQPMSWRLPDESQNAGCRLLAIQQAGRLLANSPRKSQWLAQFTLPVERIWALLACGESPAAFDEIGKLAVEREEREVVGQAYAALLIEEGDGKRLARWGSEDPGAIDARWDMASAALVQMLAAGWRVNDVGIFAGAPAIKRWQLAGVLVSRGLHRQACELAETVPDELPASSDSGLSPVCAVWTEIANWKLTLRDPDAAIEALDRAIAAAAPTGSFGGPLLTGIHARWLLTPKDLREDYEKAILAKLEGKPKSSAAILFAAMKGEPVSPGQMEVYSPEGASLSSQWAEYVQRSGLQLEEWGLPRLARELYRRHLLEDRVVPALQGQGYRTQTENMLIANQIIWSKPESLRYLTNEWLAREPSNDELFQMASRLKANGKSDRAAVVLTALFARDPRDDSVKGGIIPFLDNSATGSIAAAYVEKLVREPRGASVQPFVQNAAIRLASLDETAGNYTRSLGLLEGLEKMGVPRRTFTVQRARILAKLGKHREALEEFDDMKPALASNPEAVRMQAALAAGFGRNPAGASVAESGEEGPKPEEEKEAAEELLANLNLESGSKANRFRAGSEFLMNHSDLADGLRKSELARLSRLAGRDPKLRSDYYALRERLAERLGRLDVLEQELVREWDEGRGAREAAEVLVLVYLQQKKIPELGRLLDQLLDDRYFNEGAWDTAGQLLLGADQPALAARVFSALVARAPGSPTRAVLLAEALWKSGDQARAREIVFPIERMAALDWSKRFDLARFELAIGNSDAARRHLSALSGRPVDPSVTSMWAKLAEQFLAAGKLEEAAESLSRAMLVPDSLKGTVFADYQERKGDLASRAPGTSDFSLPPSLLRAYQVEAAARLAAEDKTEQAWLWLEAASQPLWEPKGRELLGDLEKSDPGRAAKLWDAALGPDAAWEVRCAAAQFHLRAALAETNSALRLAGLIRAHDLHPGSFAIAAACAKEFESQGEKGRARQCYQDVIDSFAVAEDRAKAGKLLDEF